MVPDRLAVESTEFDCHVMVMQLFNWVYKPFPNRGILPSASMMAF